MHSEMFHIYLHLNLFILHLFLKKDYAAYMLSKRILKIYVLHTYLSRHLQFFIKNV